MFEGLIVGNKEFSDSAYKTFENLCKKKNDKLAGCFVDKMANENYELGAGMML